MSLKQEELLGLLRTFESRSRALWAKYGERKKRPPGLAGYRGFAEEVEQLMRYGDFVEQQVTAGRLERKPERQKRLSALRWQSMLLRLHCAHDFFGDMVTGRRPVVVGAETVARLEIEHLDKLEAYFTAHGSDNELPAAKDGLVDKLRAAVERLCQGGLELEDLTDSEAEPEADAPAPTSAPQPVAPSAPAAAAAVRKPKRKRSEMSDAEKRLARIVLPIELRSGQRYLARNALEVVTKARQEVGLTNPDLAKKTGIPDTVLALLIGGHDPIPQAYIERLEAVLSGLEANAFLTSH